MSREIDRKKHKKFQSEKSPNKRMNKRRNGDLMNQYNIRLN